MSSTFREAFDQLPQGDGISQPDNLNIGYNIEFPEITLRTVDGAMKKWFEMDQPIFITNHQSEARQVPTLWSTEERWATMQKHPNIRDAHGQLNLPLISIRRANVDNLYERTVPVDEEGTANLKLFVHEYINPTNNRKEYRASYMKDPNTPIVEIIEILPPKVVRITYTVLFWTNFMKDMNPMLEHMITKFHNKHAIYASPTLYFGARLDGITNDSNDANVQQDEKIFKYGFNIIVDAPIVTKDSIRRKRTLQGYSFKTEFRTVGDDIIKKFFGKDFKWHDKYRIKG